MKHLSCRTWINFRDAFIQHKSTQSQEFKLSVKDATLVLLNNDNMEWKSSLLTLLLNASFYVLSTGYSHSRSVNSEWGTWGQCSVTCGQGTQTRVRARSSVETRPCVRKFCPGYMDWPRFYFSGSIVMDSSTVNNIRCNYNNRHFTSTALSRFTTSEVSKQKNKVTRYKNQQFNWNPMGSGHVYFVDTFLSAMCQGPTDCDTSSTIKSTVLRELERAQIVNPDADKQSACEIWGLTIVMPGILEASYRAAGSQQDGSRNTHPRTEEKGYAYGQVGRFKSKLENVTWYSSYYQTAFNNATSLSMTFAMDLYNQLSRTGRISGAVGLTSSDDPIEQTATRILKPLHNGLHAPFFLHLPQRVVTLDLSTSVGTYYNGTFKSKNLYLAMKINCRFPLVYPQWICSNLVTATSGLTYYPLEDLSSNYLDSNEHWYKVKGGIVDVSLAHHSSHIIDLMQNHRLAVIKMVPHTDITFKEYLLEPHLGINIGLLDAIIKRLNVGQTTTYTPFVSQYGQPLVGADLTVAIAPYRATLDCNIKECSLTLSEPADALHIESTYQSTNASGMNSFQITAVKDPGNLRCGVDGQLYAFAVKLRYHLPGKTYTFVNTDSSYVSADFNLRTIRPLTRLYNQVPVKKCPGWLDIEDIFEQYHNLYPVMWVNGIINLHSYLEVKQKARLLKLAMFETDFSQPKYMPASRDLSLSKQQLIWNWMECGMKFDTSTSKPAACSAGDIESGKKMVIRLLETAVNVELATIPPYFTAWLSLKTEESRNLGIALQIKSVYTEEMLHMSLAGNLLNSVGGSVNLTDMNHLPAYPTTLGSGSFFELAPTTMLSLEKFSIGLVRDVFTRVEKPSSPDERKILLEMAELWKLLAKVDDVPSSKMQLLLDEYDAAGSPASIDTDQTKKTTKLALWEAINSYALKRIQPQVLIVRTIGGLYNKVLLHMAYLESCLQIERIKSGNSHGGTLFVGDPEKQLNMTQWYDPSQFSTIEDNVALMSHQMSKEELTISKSKSSLYVKKFKEQDFGRNSSLSKPLFPVTDLRTAIQAVIEIIYQGEGGSPCSLFRKSKLGAPLGYENSHYAKFWEIVKGRKLKKVDLATYAHPPDCLDVTDYNCPKSDANNSAFCYVGREIPFDENGVWPIVSNPGPYSYAKGTDAYVLDRQFNIQYTRMLWCLQDVFGGNRYKMRTCLGDMYDLIITGKKLVATPLKRSSSTYTDMRASCNECHATPTWIFTRDLDYRAGLDLDV